MDARLDPPPQSHARRFGGGAPRRAGTHRQMGTVKNCIVSSNTGDTSNMYICACCHGNAKYFIHIMAMASRCLERTETNTLATFGVQAVAAAPWNASG